MHDPRTDHKKIRRFEGKRHARALNFCCFADRPFLRSERACRWLVRAVALSSRKHDVHIWAYVIMPTHAHLLVFPFRNETLIATFLKSLKQSVTRSALIHVRKHRPESLRVMRDEQPNGKVSYRFWQRGAGFDRNLWNPRPIWSMIDYIHANPVTAGLCKQAIDWPWSSAREYSLREPGPIPLNRTYCPPDPR